MQAHMRLAGRGAPGFRSLGRAAGRRVVRRLRPWVLAAAAATVGLLTPVAPAYAATTITVTTTADELINNGKCSLREAILAANRNAAVDSCGAGISTARDSITLPAGLYQLTRTDAPPPDEPFPPLDEDGNLTGDLDLRGGLVIRGAGATRSIIDAGQINRVMQVMAGANITLQDLTIRNGLTHVGQNGGGIKNGGTLTIVSSTITGNGTFPQDRIPRLGAPIFLPGGGIDNTGTLSLIDSVVTANGTTGPGGGIANEGVLHVVGSTISANGAGCFGFDSGACGGGDGGGVANTGNAEITQSTIDANSADQQGGGIWNSGVLSITQTTISHNTAANRASGSVPLGGGGIFNSGGLFDTAIGNATVSNTTISGNISELAGCCDGQGGGVLNMGSLSLTSSTVSDNTADTEGGGLFNKGVFEGTPIPTPPQLSLSMSLVAGNQARNLSDHPPVVTPDCGGQALVSKGSNLIGNPSGCTLGGISTGNLLGVDAKLARLGQNGGPLLTHSLQDGSPAIDAVKTGACPAADQRGVARPQDGNLDGRAVCDIGALEWRRAPPTCALSDSGTDAAGRGFLRVTARDTLSGLRSVSALQASNMGVAVPSFAVGTHGPVVVTATRQNQALPAQVALRVTNVANRSLVCDPVVMRLADRGGGTTRQVFAGVAAVDSNVQLRNGAPGLDRVDLEVNGHTFQMDHLRAGEVRTLDVGSAMRVAGPNTLAVTTHGAPASSATLSF